MWFFRKTSKPLAPCLLRRNALEAARLTVYETDAVTCRRSSTLFAEGFILEGESIFDQIERFLPFDQWEALELFKYVDGKKTSNSTLYVKKKMEVEEAKKCRQLLDVDLKDSILTRCSLGYELALFKISTSAAHKQFVILQSHAWMSV
jgi:hypothetical protein